MTFFFIYAILMYEIIYVIYIYIYIYIIYYIIYNINILKVNNRNTRTKCEICSKLTVKTPERSRRRSGVFIVNFEHISHFVLVFQLLTLNM